jgi:hypothetical protein
MAECQTLLRLFCGRELSLGTHKCGLAGNQGPDTRVPFNEEI